MPEAPLGFHQTQAVIREVEQCHLGHAWDSMFMKGNCERQGPRGLDHSWTDDREQ